MNQKTASKHDVEAVFLLLLKGDCSAITYSKRAHVTFL